MLAIRTLSMEALSCGEIMTSMVWSPPPPAVALERPPVAAEPEEPPGYYFNNIYNI